MRLVGIGFRGAAELSSLQNAVQKTLTKSGGKIDAVVTESAKSREKVFRELAEVLQVPGLGIARRDLELMITPTQSQRIQDQFGTGSLAEAAALAAAGPTAQLVVERLISDDGRATAAIAQS